MATATKGINVLRRILENACAKQKASLSDLTVLSAAVDPYRLDTDAGHRDGAWLAAQLNKLCGPATRIHWRGLHYAIVQETSVKKPNGEIYRVLRAPAQPQRTSKCRCLARQLSVHAPSRCALRASQKRCGSR
jgi:hypothetical protein